LATPTDTHAGLRGAVAVVRNQAEQTAACTPSLL